MRISRIVRGAVAICATLALMHCTGLVPRERVDDLFLELRIDHIQPNTEVWFLDSELEEGCVKALRDDPVQLSEPWFFAHVETRFTLTLSNPRPTGIMCSKSSIWAALWAPDIWMLDDDEGYWRFEPLTNHTGPTGFIVVPARGAVTLSFVEPVALVPATPGVHFDFSRPLSQQSIKYPQRLHHAFVSDTWDEVREVDMNRPIEKSIRLIRCVGTCDIE